MKYRLENSKLIAKTDLDSTNLSKMEIGMRDFYGKNLSVFALIFRLDKEE